MLPSAHDATTPSYHPGTSSHNSPHHPRYTFRTPAHMSSPSFTILPLTPLSLSSDRQAFRGLGEQTETKASDVQRPAWMHSAVTLSANGHSLIEIAQSLTKDVKAVSQLLTSEWAKEQVLAQVSETKGFSAEVKSLTTSTRDAILTLQELMVTGDPKTRFAAAKEILNRTLGVPTQKVQHLGTGGKMDVREEIEALRKELNLTN